MHQPTLIRTSPINNIANILQSKRNALKISTANSLSNLIAFDSQQKSPNYSKSEFSQTFEPPTSSAKSMTLPGKSNSSIQSAKQSDSNIASQSHPRTMSSSKSSSALITTVKVNTNKEQHEQLNLALSIKNIYVSSLPLINLININQDEIEEIWKLHIQTMLNSNVKSSFCPIDSFYLFKKLFKETRHRLDSLLSECYHYLSRDTKLFLQIEKHLVNIIDLINTKLDCPVVYFDQEWFLQLISLNSLDSKKKSKTSLLSKSFDSSGYSSCSFIENHRQILWEIGENYDTFVFIKQGVTEVLNQF